MGNRGLLAVDSENDGINAESDGIKKPLINGNTSPGLLHSTGKGLCISL